MADFIISLSILDADGHTATLQHYVDAADADAAATRAAALAPIVDDLTGGQITQIGVIQVVDLPVGLKGAPAAGSDVEIKGKFVWNSAGGFTTISSIPAFLKDAPHTVVGGDVNTANADILAYVNEIVGQGYTDYRSADITSLRKGYEAFRDRKRSR